jgi:ubiquinone/menaquinone biosynthesis C-methylase UbiE
MKNQHDLWNELHGKSDLLLEPSSFVSEMIPHFPPGSTILELGCGAGTDSVALAQAGHQVTATDFSDVAIDKNTQRYQHIPNLIFQVMDMTQPFPFGSEQFDIVYARLSLHYFTEEKTHEIFREIYRVLKPGGLLCFICKSTADHRYGQGTMIEPDMYDYKGHVRHFFSKSFVNRLLEGLFEPGLIEEGRDYFYSYEAGYIKVIARKK